MKLLYAIGLTKLIQPVSAQGLCATMGSVPPPPEYSTCWQFWVPPENGIVLTNSSESQKECNNVAYEKAVCDCDSYCCDVAWDESCRGYQQEMDGAENNYFVTGCSARILCCEEIIAPGLSPVAAPIAQAVLPILGEVKEFICENIGTEPPPVTSTCWQWWTPPSDGIVTSDMPEPQKGCDYEKCQNVVCACDSYCCDMAWDESCRGY